MSLIKSTNLALARQQSMVEREQRTAEATLVRARKAQSFRERMTPLPDRVRRFAVTIPASVKLEGVPIALFVDNLAGKYRGHANAADVGKALRSLGWNRTRAWRNESNGFSALWFPPTVALPKTMFGDSLQQLAPLHTTIQEEK